MTGNDVIGLCIVDDHTLFRCGLKSLVGDEEDLGFVGEAGTAEDGLALVREWAGETDVLVLDLSLPDGSSLGVLKQLRDEEIAVPVLVLTSHAEELHGEVALQAGAQGFLDKGVDLDRLMEAIRKIADGQIVVSESLQERMLRRFGQNGPNRQPSISQLSEREFEVFELLGRGKSAKEIADMLGLSPKTVHTYRERIKNKLEISSSSKLLRVAVMWTEKGL